MSKRDLALNNSNIIKLISHKKQPTNKETKPYKKKKNQ